MGKPFLLIEKGNVLKIVLNKQLIVFRNKKPILHSLYPTKQPHKGLIFIFVPLKSKEKNSKFKRNEISTPF